MSHTTKIVLGIVVLIVVLGAAFYLWHKTASAPETTGAQNPSGTEEVTTLPSGSSSSDAAINQDLTSIDAQIQAVGTDNASANDSVNAAAAQ